VCLALAVSRPEHEERHHDHPAADAEQPGEEAADDADRAQLDVERVSRSAIGPEAGTARSVIAASRATIPPFLDPVDQKWDPI
jgi:hypothetical protein